MQLGSYISWLRGSSLDTYRTRATQPGVRCTVSKPVQVGSPLRTFGPGRNKLRPSNADGARDAPRCYSREKSPSSMMFPSAEALL
jgi:hypothetical protein